LTSGKSRKISHYKGAIQFSFSIILTVIFLYIAFRNVDVATVIKVVSNASWFWIGVLFFTLLFSHFIRAVRWKIILRSVKKDITLTHLFGALMIGYGVNCVVPRLGEVSRAVFLAKWEKLSRSSMFGAVIVERVIDVIFLGLSVIISVYLWRQDLYTSFPWLKSSLEITLILMICVILFLILTIKYKEKFYGILIKMLERFSSRIAQKAGHIFSMLIEGFGSLKGVGNYTVTIFLSVVIMLSYALGAYIGFFTIGMQNILPVNFKMAWVLMSISGIGVVIPTPGATGSYHALAKSILILFGFGEAVSFSYAFLTHIVSYLMFIVLGLLSFVILNKRHESLIKIVETGVEEI
jgi:glycosyltransferase 2 family protein